MLSRVLPDDGKRNEDSIRAVAAAAMITTLQAMKMVAKYKLALDLNEWIGLSCILMCVWGSMALVHIHRWAGDAYLYIGSMACEPFVNYKYY